MSRLDLHSLIAISAQGLKFLTQTITLVVLAHWLTPEDFGVIAMITAFTALLDLIKDGGFSALLVQRENLSQSEANTLFCFVAGSSCLMAISTVAGGPLLAWFYKDQRVASAAFPIALSLLFGGIALGYQSLLRRQMRFVTLAYIEVSAMVLGSLAAIFASTRGMGYWAIAIQPAVTNFALLALCWYFCSWRLRFLFDQAASRLFLGLGANLMGFQFVNFAARNFDNILIGRLFGPGELGLYSRAYSLFTIPISQISGPISTVALPSLSRLRNDPSEYRLCYLKYAHQILSLALPLSAFMIVMANELVEVLLGARWSQSAVLFRILSVCMICQPLYNFSGTLFVSHGRAKLLFRLGVVNSLLTVCAFAVGASYGTEGVAAAYSIYTIVQIIPWLLMSFSFTTIVLKDILIVASVPITSGLFCAASCLIFKASLQGVPTIVALISGALSLLVSIALSLLLSRRTERFRASEMP